MKVFVTGASGQLGRELCRQLGRAAVPSYHDLLDVTNASAVRAALRTERPQVVVNCAAYTQVDRAESEPAPCRAVNAMAVAHLAETCSDLSCSLLQISTDYVFTGNTPLGRPYTEHDRPVPCGVYATTKYEGERAAAHCRHWIVRTCGLYARPEHTEAHNFVRTILRLAEAGSPLRVVADQHCTPSYVPHVARAICFLIGADGPAAPFGLYHVVNGGATTWYDFACELLQQAGQTTAIEPITTAQYAARAPRPAYSVLDTSAYKALGGPVLPEWRTALTEYISEHRILNH